MTVAGGKKQRLDQELVARGLVESRARAQALVMAGQVYSGERRLDKPGMPVAADMALALRGQDHPWVSRGGLKLAHALTEFGIDPTGRICLDVGASTGGFTDVLLAHGAARVYAVDVGRGQLAWKLREDARVVVLEAVNARYLTAEAVPEPIGLLVCDASFIGLRTLLPAPLALVAGGGEIAVLVKPQFEAGRDRVGKGGVVRDPAVHDEVCATIADWLAAQPGWTVGGMAVSPITGPQGNREFLLHARKADDGKT